MASSSSGPDPRVSKKDELYSRCALKPPGHIFHQEDLEKLKVADNVNELLALCQALSKDELFEILELENRACYRLRSRDEAQKLVALSRDEYLVYRRIEAHGTMGIWSRHLRSKTQLHKTIMDRCLKALETKKYIKRVKSVKTPGQIIFMKEGLHPSEEVTGGSWFSENELDVDFIEEVSRVVVDYVRKRSWFIVAPLRTHRSKGAGKKRAAAPAVAVAEAGDGEMEVEIVDEKKARPPMLHSRTPRLVPFPAGYPGYPTTDSILDFLENEQLIQGKHLSLQDLQQVIDVLVFDGRLEKLTGAVSGLDDPDDMDVDIEERYRWARQVDDFPALPSVGFNETPCSKCPVFNMCEAGGPVDAKNCGYFEQWLSI